MRVWLGLDIGTGSSKAIALDAEGGLVASASSDHETHRPEPFAYEHNPNDLRSAAFSALAELAAGLGEATPAGLGVSGAMHTLLPVRGNAPLSAALTWADARCRGEIASLAGELDRDARYQRTGCPLAVPFHPARLRWLARRHPELFRTADAFVAVKDWLLRELTGLWATDYATASATGLFDLRAARWDEPALRLAGIDDTRLPPPVEPATRVGGLDAEAARATGLPEGLPVFAGASDGALANVGAGAGFGRTVVTLGTSGAVRALAREPRLDPGRRTFCYRAFSDAYLVGGAINNGGLALEWAASFLAPGEGVAGVLRRAERAEPGADELLFHPYLAGERTPFWDPALAGGFSGLRAAHGPEAMARAVVEGVAFALADAWAAYPAPHEALERPPLLTGGVVRSPFWCQLVADVLGRALVPADAGDASARGAALVAARAAGAAIPAGEPDGGEIAPEMHRHRETYAPALERFRATGPKR